jgi:hypothetical protein
MRLITNAFSQTMCSAPPAGCSWYPSYLSRLKKERIIWFEEFPIQQVRGNFHTGRLQLRSMQTKTYTYFLGTWGNIYQSIIHKIKWDPKLEPTHLPVGFWHWQSPESSSSPLLKTWRGICTRLCKGDLNTPHKMKP